MACRAACRVSARGQQRGGPRRRQLTAPSRVDSVKEVCAQATDVGPSLFDRREKSHWWLPHKPTLFYMYDVIADSQKLADSKTQPGARPWWVSVPSGRWRVAKSAVSWMTKSCNDGAVE